jgi:hypothetical protein
MAIIGFNFTKLAVERKKQIEGKVNISNNVSIKSIEPSKLALGSVQQNTLRISFLFSSEYQPDVASITLAGDVLYLHEGGDSQKLLQEWEKTKALPPEIMKGVLNHILQKCNIEALLLSKEVALPPPVRLPQVEATTKTIAEERPKKPKAK